MARKRRRRPAFRPFRMTERFQKAVLVALGVFLMVIFAVPTGTCLRRRRVGGRDPHAVAMRIDGEDVTFGELEELKARWQLVFRRRLNDGAAADVLARRAEAERLGIRVPDAQVLDAIKHSLFPRLVTVEYLFARYSDFEDNADRAAAALAAARKEIAGLIGDPLRGAMQRQAAERDLGHGQTDPFTHRTAPFALTVIADVPDIVQRAYEEPIGRLSEVVRLEDRACLFRVVQRTAGFGPDGLFYREREGWVGEGYGVADTQDYDELLRDLRLTQAQLEQTLRESITYDLVFDLYARSVVGPPDPRFGMPDGSALPRPTVRGRYQRDSTQVIAAHFSLDTADFARSVSTTEDELRSFYEQHKGILRTETRVGYLEPERASIEFVLGRRRDIEKALSDRELRAYYAERRAQFEGKPFEEALPEVRTRLAKETLQRLIGGLVVKATERARRGEDPGLAELAEEAARQSGGAFVCARSPLVSEREADRDVPELRGGGLAEKLFGEQSEQFLLPDEPSREGARYISPDFACEAGRYFFHVLERKPSREVPYEEISAATRDRLIQDLTRHKAALAAQDEARDYRARIHQAAFEGLAKTLGVEPVETDFLKPDSPLPSVGKPVPELYRPLALGAPGLLGHFVREGKSFLIARLAERDDAQGLKLHLLALPKDRLPENLDELYQPAQYELQARYQESPYPFLDQPSPIPFETVRDDIVKLLTRRRALDLAIERVQAAHKVIAAGEEPPAELAPIAQEHHLAFTPNLKVDLAHPETAPQIGRAAGFRRAVQTLEPGQVSEPLASADGRFLFRLRSRDDQGAVIDVLAALYEPLRKEVKLPEGAAREYYDERRDIAFVTGDEIKPPPPWDELPEAARERVRQALRREWAEQPLPERLRRLRTSQILEAFRTVPARHPLKTPRAIRPTVRTAGPFQAADAPEPFRGKALEAVRELAPGQLSEPLEVEDGALLALVTDRGADGTMEVSYVVVRSWEWEELGPPQEPAEEALRKHYEARREQFRRPDELQIEYLAVTYDDLARTLTATEEELRKEYDRGVTARDTIYRDHTKRPDYVPLPYEQAKDTARRQVLQRKARDAAETLLGKVRQELEAAEGAPDFAALAAKHAPLQRGLSSFFQRDRRTLKPIGLAPELVKKAFAAEEGEVIGPVFGLDGACLARRHAFQPSRIPPLEEVRSAVLADYRRRQAKEKALAAAARLRERVQEAVADAEDKAEAFRSAVAARPITFTVPKQIAVRLTQPFYPPGSPMARRNAGPARQAEFAATVFTLRIAELSDVIPTPDQTTCYVATPTRIVPPDPPSPFHLAMTRRVLGQRTDRMLQAAWQEYLNEKITAAP